MYRAPIVATLHNEKSRIALAQDARSEFPSRCTILWSVKSFIEFQVQGGEAPGPDVGWDRPFTFTVTVWAMVLASARVAARFPAIRSAIEANRVAVANGAWNSRLILKAKLGALICLTSSSHAIILSW